MKRKDRVSRIRLLAEEAGFSEMGLYVPPSGNYHSLSKKVRRDIEKYMQERFRHWWNIWIEPDLRVLRRT